MQQGALLWFQVSTITTSTATTTLHLPAILWTIHWVIPTMAVEKTIATMMLAVEPPVPESEEAAARYKAAVRPIVAVLALVVSGVAMVAAA